MGCCMSVRRQRELEEEEMGRKGGTRTRWALSKFASLCFDHYVQLCTFQERGSVNSIARPVSYQVYFQLFKEGGKERRRHRGESGWWKGGESGEGEFLRKNSWFFLIFFVEGEEGVGRVWKPDCEARVHPEEILQEVKLSNRRRLEYLQKSFTTQLLLCNKWE